MHANWRTVVPALARAALLHLRGRGAPPPTPAELAAAGAAAVEAFHTCPNLELLVE